MTVTELLEQAKTLNSNDFDKLLNQLLAMREESTVQQPDNLETTKHWGQALNQAMDDVGLIEMQYPEIDDPVVWLKKLRADKH